MACLNASPSILQIWATVFRRTNAPEGFQGSRIGPVEIQAAAESFFLMRLSAWRRFFLGRMAMIGQDLHALAFFLYFLQQEALSFMREAPRLR